MICRLCLRTISDMAELDSLTKTNNNELIFKINECLCLQINIDSDIIYGLPTFVCNDCTTKLNEWHEFKKQTYVNDKFLKQNIKSKLSIKLYDTNDEPLERKSTTLNENEENKKYGTITHSSLSESDNLGHNNFTHHSTDIKSEDDSDPLELNDSNICDYNNELDIKQETFAEFVPNSHYECDICLKVFQYIVDYLEHQDEHEGDPVFKCDKCSEEVFTSKKDLVYHEYNHKIPCKICGKMVLPSSMRTHRNQHTDKYKCSQCLLKFGTKNFLRDHIICRHTNIKRHICELCGKRFPTSTCLRVHLQSHGERNYKCKDCDFAGKTASSLFLHVSKHAQETHICEKCSKVFKSYRNLYDHLRRVHIAEKKYACTWKQCTMKFIDRYLLRTHMRIHTGSRPYECTKCEKSFIRSDSLREHLRTHDKTIFFECIKCSKKFTTKRGRTRHRCISVSV